LSARNGDGAQVSAKSDLTPDKNEEISALSFYTRRENGLKAAFSFPCVFARRRKIAEEMILKERVPVGAAELRAQS
jgi:hypothetical protein